MKNLSFALWMLGYPILSELVNYLQFLQEKICSDAVEVAAVFPMLAIWIFVGYKLYEPREKPEK